MKEIINTIVDDAIDATKLYFDIFGWVVRILCVWFVLYCNFFM